MSIDPFRGACGRLTFMKVGITGPSNGDIDSGLIELRGVPEELHMVVAIDGEELSDSASHDLIEDFEFHLDLLPSNIKYLLHTI